MVRIHLPPAENPQTIGSSAAEPIAPRSEGSWRDLTTTLISAGSHLEDWFCFAGEVTVTLVKDAILAVHQGEFVAITGASGSAKSPLLYLLNSSAWASSNGGTVRPRAQQRDLVFSRSRNPDAPTWTEDNLLRQVVYEGLREDKPAAEVRRAMPHPKLAGPTRPSSRTKRLRSG
jgi:ABC-type uncharacterized transport system fused permease/ATPase subunit